MDTRRVSGQTISSTPQQSKISEFGVRSSELDKHSSEFKQVAQAIRLRLPCGIAAGNSVIVLGEAGTGKTDFALALHEELSGEFNSAIATYKGSIKKFFVAIAMQLGCPSEDERDRPLVVM